MAETQHGRIAIVYPGDADIRRSATPQNNRFAPLFQAFAEAGITAEPAVYHDEFCDEVRAQLMQVDAALVWVNPIEGGNDRTKLDGMLCEVADGGVFVSAHPDIILRMGTKEVLYETRAIGWGCDIHLYRTMTDLRHELPLRLARGEIRVLKQYRGHSGIGVWKIASALGGKSAPSTDPKPLAADALVHVRHAQRGSVEEVMTLGEFFTRCEPYFAKDERMIDQVYQSRLDEGMFRCYLVHDQIAGFGHQAVNALFPAPLGKDASEAPQPGPRLYYPPSMPEAQALKHNMEETWLPALQQLLKLNTEQLPVLWDADFLLGPKDSSGKDTHVLCEINVSSVAPFPDSAIPFIVKAAQMRVAAVKQKRQSSFLFERV